MADGPTGTSNTLLTWNVSNWITVVIMASIGFFLLGLAQKWYQARQKAAA